jgi:transcriptional regulator with XRE-family HTH domain
MSAPGKRRRGGLSKATMLGIGARITSLRLRCDRNQQEFAQILDVPAGVLAAWELGGGIERKDLILIADRTAASLHWLISGLTPAEFDALWAEAYQSLGRLRSEKSRLRSDPLATQAAEIG